MKDLSDPWRASFFLNNTKVPETVSFSWGRTVLYVSVLEKFCILEEEEPECGLTVATATNVFLMEGKDK